jgi:hypothetical protein
MGYKWILCYVDHLSGFAHVAPLKTKKAAVVRRALVCIMTTTVLPKILNSDNGSEFLCKFIEFIKKYFKMVNIVKSKPHHPQTQDTKFGIKSSIDYFKCVQHTRQKPETHHTPPSHRDWVTIHCASI